MRVIAFIFLVMCMLTSCQKSDNNCVANALYRHGMTAYNGAAHSCAHAYLYQIDADTEVYFQIDGPCLDYIYPNIESCDGEQVLPEKATEILTNASNIRVIGISQ